MEQDRKCHKKDGRPKRGFSSYEEAYDKILWWDHHMHVYECEEHGYHLGHRPYFRKGE